MYTSQFTPMDTLIVIATLISVILIAVDVVFPFIEKTTNAIADRFAYALGFTKTRSKVSDEDLASEQDPVVIYTFLKDTPSETTRNLLCNYLERKARRERAE